MTLEWQYNPIAIWKKTENTTLLSATSGNSVVFSWRIHDLSFDLFKPLNWPISPLKTVHRKIIRSLENFFKKFVIIGSGIDLWVLFKKISKIHSLCWSVGHLKKYSYYLFFYCPMGPLANILKNPHLLIFKNILKFTSVGLWVH